MYPKISIVTPNFNQGEFLEATIQSVLEQNYPNLEYIIMDGGSTDKSLDIIKKYESRIHLWVSEPDEGMYDAINRGFQNTSGEIMGWINSDDMLINRSLFTLAEIFENENVEWVQGQHNWFDKYGRLFQSRPVRLRSKYNYLLKEYHKGLSPFIQQESTYWRRSIWQRAGGYVSTEYELAGDFELWMRFFKHGQLFLTNSSVGGFRVHSTNQKSISNYQLYLKEADQIIDNYNLSGEEANSIKFLKERNIIDKIPFARRSRFKLRRLLKDDFKLINWNSRTGKFQIK